MMSIVRRLTGFTAAVVTALVAFTAAPALARGTDIQLHYVATIRVDVEPTPQYFKIRLVHADDISAAFANRNNKNNQHVNGKIVRPDPDVNTGYTWHLDPDDLAFVDLSTEVCDGAPSDVESGALTSDRYCPWSSRVVDMQTLWVSAAG